MGILELIAQVQFKYLLILAVIVTVAIILAAQKVHVPLKKTFTSFIQRATLV